MEIARRARAAGWGIARRLADRCMILIYHRVANAEIDPWSLCVTPKHFAEHLQVLRDAYTVVTVRDLGQALRERRLVNGAVAISFDDGYADNLYNARPILKEYELPATIFMTTGQLDSAREFWWDELEQLLLNDRLLPKQLTLDLKAGERSWQTSPEPDDQRVKSVRAWEGAPGSRMVLFHTIWETLLPLPRDERNAALDQLKLSTQLSPELRPSHRCVTADEIRGIAKDDLIDIGAHTVNHLLLTAHIESVQRREIEDNKSQLEELTGKDIHCFAYPFGDHGVITTRLAREADYECACTTVENTVWRFSDPYRMPRFAVEDWGGDEFAKRLRRQLGR